MGDRVIWSDSENPSFSRMGSASCANGACDFEMEPGWEQVGKIGRCPKCGTLMELFYDEVFDAETGDEHTYAYFLQSPVW